MGLCRVRPPAQANISFSGARLNISTLHRPDYILKCHFAPPPPPPHIRETETPRFVLMKPRFTPYYDCSRSLRKHKQPPPPDDVVSKTAPANFLRLRATMKKSWRRCRIVATARCGLTGRVGGGGGGEGGEKLVRQSWFCNIGRDDCGEFLFWTLFNEVSFLLCRVLSYSA